MLRHKVLHKLAVDGVYIVHATASCPTDTAARVFVLLHPQDGLRTGKCALRQPEIRRYKWTQRENLGTVLQVEKLQ